MKLPNGFGSVYRLQGNRRRPWIARKTTGWTPEGKQLYYTVGYFKTRTEAMSALVEYNKNPIGDRRDTTLEEVYKRWSKSKFQKIGESTIQTYEAAWKHLSSLAEAEIRSLRKSHIQEIIDDMSQQGLSHSSCNKVKTLAGVLFKEAMADDVISQNYAAAVELPDKSSNRKDRFSDMEIKKIEELAAENIWAGTILILIYTGLRVGEMLALTKFNVDIDNMVIAGGAKTDAGRNRVIPVHPKIQEHIKHWYNQQGDRLITKDGKRIRVDYYRRYLYYPALEKAEVRALSPHSARHTFASLLNAAKVQTKNIQDLIGHANYSTTANTYTHPDLEELRQAIESI